MCTRVETTIFRTLSLGVASLDDLSPAQTKYADKVRAKLDENARRLRGESLEAMKFYKKGILAYSKGLYSDSVQWMEVALEETDERTLLGGKILIQKALGLDASGRRDDSLELYQYIIDKHPEGKIKKQAEELKYILEAPEMVIGEDERVEVPLLRDEYYSGGAYRDKWVTGSGGGSGAKRPDPSIDDMYGGDFEPNVRLPQNPLITVFGLAIAAGIAAYSATLTR